VQQARHPAEAHLSSGGGVWSGRGGTPRKRLHRAYFYPSGPSEAPRAAACDLACPQV